MEDDIKVPDNIEAEFDPLVVIVADDRARYDSFAAHLIKNGFKCELYEDIPEALLESPVPGTIYFVSFNLKSADAGLLARRIEQKSNLCIVFAEQQGIETAAKLSSAKLTQTLQHPYTEKNFTMAVQTIVKKRRVQYEKALRKQSVLERRKGMTESSAPVEDTGNQVFKGDVKTVSGLTPLIFEERVRGRKFEAVIEGHPYISGHSHFTRDRRRRGLMEIQKGLTGATFMMMPSASTAGRSQLVKSGGASSGHVVHAEGARSALGDTSRTGTDSGDGGSVRSLSSAAEKAASVSQAGLAQGATSASVQTALESKPMSIATETKKSSDGIAYMPSGEKDRAGAQAKTASQAESGTREAFAAASKLTATTTAQMQKATARDESLDDSSSAKARVKLEGEALIGYSKDDLRKEGVSKSAVTAREEPLAESSQKTREPSEPVRQTEVTKIAGNIAVPTWALIAAASIGILFVLFFLFQMIFQRH